MTSDRAPAKRPKAADVTPWFSCRNPPVREGLYQVLMDGLDEIEHQLWFDGRWLTPLDPRFGYMSMRQTPMGLERGDKWRGLRKPAT